MRGLLDVDGDEAPEDVPTEELQAQGDTVIVNRLGAAPLDQATVVAVRPGQTYSRTDTGVPGAGNDIHTTVTGKTVYVDVK